MPRRRFYVGPHLLIKLNDYDYLRLVGDADWAGNTCAAIPPIRAIIASTGLPRSNLSGIPAEYS